MTPSNDSIRPFDVDIERSEMDDLRRRLAETRWPDQLPDTGWE